MKILPFLLFLCMLPVVAGLPSLSTTEFNYELNTTDLPFSIQESITIDTYENDTITITYDNWLTGITTINFSDETTTIFDITLDVPTTTVNQYTKQASLLFTHENGNETTLPIIFNISINEVIIDEDNDGYSPPEDCNDTNPAINPNATEIYYDELDNDCDPTTIDTPLFSVAPNKQKYFIGETAVMQVAAPVGSTVTLLICPKADGWVECHSPITREIVSEQTIVPLPVTNKTDNYTIEGTLSYGTTTKYANASYEVENSLQLVIGGDRSLAEDEETTLTAVATGGKSPYTIRWTLANNTVVNANTVDLVYPNNGTYTQTVRVTDNEGNTKTITTDVTVYNEYTVTVIVKDEDTNSKIDSALVEINDETEYTDSQGEVRFTLRKREYDVYITKEGYGTKLAELDVNGTTSITYELRATENDEPTITTLTPSGSVFTDEAYLRFRAYDDGTVSCSLYFGKGNEQWLAENETIENITDSIERKFTLNNLETGSYVWRVDCTDNRGNTASMTPFTFVIQEQGEVVTLSNNVNDVIKEFEQSLTRLATLVDREKQAAEAFNIKDLIHDAITQIERNERDIHNLVFRTDMDESQKEQRQDELRAKTEQLTKTTPISLTVKDVNRYVKYIREEELQAIFESYNQKDPIDVELFTKYHNNIQEFLTVSTSIYNVDFIYLDGSSEPVTIVEKELTWEDDIDSSWYVLEYIPGYEPEIYSEHESLGTGFYRMKADTILYVLKGTITAEKTKGIDTILFSPKPVHIKQQITGFSIFGMEEFELNIKTGLIMLIVLLILIYGFYALDGTEHIKGTYYLIFKDKHIKYIKVLINDALDYVDADDDLRASLVYREIKLSYEGLTPHSRSTVYEDSKEVCDTLNARYIGELIARLTVKIQENNKPEIKEEWLRLKGTFPLLSEENKTKYQLEYNELKTRCGEIIA